jgi:transcriptional regulator with XRE-family HTH domain
VVDGAVAATTDSGESFGMSELVRIIDEYKAAHGQPSDSSICRAIGIAPQTLSSWRKRGISEPPATETLRRLAEFTSLPYEEYVLQAAVFDAGMRQSMPTLEEANRRTAQARRGRDAG